MSGNYPAGVTDNDPEFDMPSGRPRARKAHPAIPMTMQVWCIECQKHWAAPVNPDKWWKTDLIQLCPEHQDEDGETESSAIPCSKCGKPTSWDPTYGDLCYRCCRASNE